MPDLTDEQRQELEELKATLLSEFHLNQEGTNDARKTALKELEDLKPDFLATLQWIVKHGQNDALKAKIAMWGFDKLLEIDKSNADPLTAFLEGMQGVATETPKADAATS